jgi:lysyl-tRNA synthetase, class II
MTEELLMREFSEQETVRRQTLEELRGIINPYPERFERNYELKDVVNLEDNTKDISVAGRIVGMRKMGKLSFIHIEDVEGKVQVLLKKDSLGEDSYTFFKKYYDVGDFVGVHGFVFTTQSGEKTIETDKITFLGKALKPLPEKFHGLQDEEVIYRERYVDLIMNEESRKRFLLRSKFVEELRKFLWTNGYIEIDTPILTNKPSGAAAKPFITHHNALDMDVYLRIATETYLKRAVVGGFTKVFELGRDFRNEGIDPNHLQDFNMIEGYGAYLNYKDNMIFLQKMLQTIIKNVFGTLEVQVGENLINFDGTWPEVTFRDLILKYSNIDIKKYNTKELLLNKIKEDKIELDPDININNLGYGNLVDQLYKKTARPNLVGPIYLTEHPIELSPLARANDDDASITDRFQLIVNGEELINAYSELVDPQEQEARLLHQAELKAKGDEDAMPMDYDYINAMEYGMPPISGWGMGIDRVIQMLTNASNIKDVVMFPLMKPKD